MDRNRACLCLARETQCLAGRYLFWDNSLFTDMEEWSRAQDVLSRQVRCLLQEQGQNADEEAEILLAVLMGYGVTIRQQQGVDLALKRAQRVFQEIRDRGLKGRLAVCCYGESRQEEFFHTADGLLDEGDPEARKWKGLLLSFREDFL